MNGRTAYEAYCEAAGWRSVRGEPLPPWGNLPQPIREAWSASAEAVLQAFFKHWAERRISELIGPDWEVHP